MARQDTIKWVRHDSVTYIMKLGESTYQFCKSFNPDDINPAYSLFFGLDTLQFKPKPLLYDSQHSLYKREICVLKTLHKLHSNLVPRILSEDPDKLQIFMEYLPQPTYHDFLKQASDEKSRCDAVTEMTDFLAEIHRYCNERFPQHCRDTCSESSHLPTRSVGQESSRFNRHLESIVSYYHQRRSLPVAEPPSLEPSSVSLAAMLKELNLPKISRKFVDRERGITRNNEFVHGDFCPQNIFYTEDPKTHTRRGTHICDFDKVRLGTTNDDLATALYNIHNYPFQEEQERFLHEAARNYFLQTDTPESELPNRQASLISSVLKSNVRDFGVHCRMDWREISRFVNDSERARYKQSAIPKETFLQEKFVTHFEQFLAYYLTGEGQELLQRAIPTISNTVRKQLRTIHKLFKRSRILIE